MSNYQGIGDLSPWRLIFLICIVSSITMLFWKGVGDIIAVLAQ
jgi:hypothetical protein